MSTCPGEYGSYLARAADVDKDFDQLEWWKLNAAMLSDCSEAANKILLFLLSFAADERVFSLLKVSFGEEQDSSPQD